MHFVAVKMSALVLLSIKHVSFTLRLRARMIQTPWQYRHWHVPLVSVLTRFHLPMVVEERAKGEPAIEVAKQRRSLSIGGIAMEN